MKKITIEIDDKYGDIITISVIGVKKGINVATSAFDINKVNYITVTESGMFGENK